MQAFIKVPVGQLPDKQQALYMLSKSELFKDYQLVLFTPSVKHRIEESFSHFLKEISLTDLMCEFSKWEKHNTNIDIDNEEGIIIIWYLGKRITNQQLVNLFLTEKGIMYGCFYPPN